MSSISIGSDASVSGVSRIGSELRAARERLGWDLPSVAEVLRIRQPFLEAIESGRIGALPGNAYAVGFLRAYAAALGLDPDETTRRFKVEAADVNRKTKLIFPAPVPERGVPAGAVVLIGLVLAIGVYAVWYRMSAPPRGFHHAVPPVPARLAARIAPAPKPAPAVAAPPVAAPSPVTPTPVRPGVAASGVAAPAAPAPAPAPNPPSVLDQGSVAAPAPAAAPVTPAQTAQTGQTAQSGQTAQTGQTAPAVPAVAAAASTAPSPAPLAGAATAQVPPAAAPGAGGVALEATADSWIEVRDRQGRVLLSRVLHAGESWALPPGQSVVMTTGNAGGTELVVNGVTSPPLGASGQVRRNLTIDPASLAGTGLAALVSPAAATTAPASATAGAGTTTPGQ